MTIPGLPAGMDPYHFRMLWIGGSRQWSSARVISNLAARAQALTKVVPSSVMRHLSTFQQSRLVLLVEKIGEFGGTAARRALRPSERRAMLQISKGINRIVAGARTAAAEEAVLGRAAQSQMQWVKNVNLRRAASRGIFGTLGVGGTIVLAAVAAIILVGVIANARQASVMEAIRAMNATGGDLQEIVYGTPPEIPCVEEEAANRGLVWSAPDGSECSGQQDCSWRAPIDVPEPIWSDHTESVLDARRAEYEMTLALFVAPRLVSAREECGIAQAAPPTESFWPIPTSDEICTFLSTGMVRLGQPPINDNASMLAACVIRDGSGGEGVRIWAEVLALDDRGTSAQEWLGGVEFSVNGSLEPLDIGDDAWLIKSTAPTDRHILAGSIGPIGYALYACSECDGSLTGDLESTARFIVQAYIDWADKQD